MASTVEILSSRFRGLYFIALLGLAVIFLLVSYQLSALDPSETTSPALRFGIAVTQELGTDFIAILIFALIFLYAIREDPKQDIRTATPDVASRQIDSALSRTREFIYLGSTGAYNLEYRIPLLVTRAAAENLNVVVSFLMPHPFMTAAFAAVVNDIGDESPKSATKKSLAIALRLMKCRQTTENITISVYFIRHASTIRYDVTDELIAMSSPLGGNPFVLFPREAPMYNEIRADLQRSMDTAVAKVSTTDIPVLRMINDELALAEHLLRIVGAPNHEFTPQMLVDAASHPLAERYRSKGHSRPAPAH